MIIQSLNQSHLSVLPLFFVDKCRTTFKSHLQTYWTANCLQKPNCCLTNCAHHLKHQEQWTHICALTHSWPCLSLRSWRSWRKLSSSTKTSRSLSPARRASWARCCSRSFCTLALTSSRSWFSSDPSAESQPLNEFRIFQRFRWVHCFNHRLQIIRLIVQQSEQPF